MEIYKKPVIADRFSATGIIPAALAAAAAAIEGLSAAKLLAVGVAVGWGAISSKGNNAIDSRCSFALTERKDFSLA